MATLHWDFDTGLYDVCNKALAELVHPCTFQNEALYEAMALMMSRSVWRQCMFKNSDPRLRAVHLHAGRQYLQGLCCKCTDSCMVTWRGVHHSRGYLLQTHCDSLVFKLGLLMDERQRSL